MKPTLALLVVLPLALIAVLCRAVDSTSPLFHVDPRALVSWADLTYLAPTEHDGEG